MSEDGVEPLEIESGYELPAVARRKATNREVIRATLERMEVGQSFVIHPNGRVIAWEVAKELGLELSASELEREAGSGFRRRYRVWLTGKGSGV